jgi:hypothetical protein
LTHFDHYFAEREQCRLDVSMILQARETLWRAGKGGGSKSKHAQIPSGCGPWNEKLAVRFADKA